MIGGLGSDTVSYAGAAGGVTVDLALTTAQNTVGAGMDTLSGFENLIGSSSTDSLTGDGNANTLSGGGSADTLVGGDGNDLLDGGAGADSMSGGLGNDTYIVDNSGDVVTEAASEGTDTVNTARSSYQLTDNVENLVFTGAGGFTGTGNGSANTITGGTGDDTLDGAAGNDSLIGNGGTDTASYASAAAGVTVSLALAGAQNTVGAGTDTLTGFANLTGSGFDDTLSGTGGDNVLNGGAGTDTASYAAATAGVTVNLLLAGAQNTVGAGSDTLISIESLTGSAFADTLTGRNGANTLIGGLGDDILNGGASGDDMEGGDGNDTYYVDDALDVVVEAANKGTDTVMAAISSYKLGNTVENLTYTAAGRFTGTGNNLANVITGGANDDTLAGRGGNDTLIGGIGEDTASYAAATGGVTVSLAIAGAQNSGGDGIDTLSGIEDILGSDFADFLTGDGGANTLSGRDGNDKLDGGAGADRLDGGEGDDLFLVDDAGDKVVERTGQGIDTVETTLNAHTLAKFVDNLVFTGAGDFAGTGNDLANTLTGGAGDDTLEGRAGGDALVGGGGSDTASYAASAGVTASLANAAINTGEAAGDSYSSIENLTGSRYADTLVGDGGDNVLTGGGRQDTLTGGGGSDSFVLDQKLVGSNVVTITDLTAGVDSVVLALSIFTTAGAAGTLNANAYFSGAAAHDADDRILYDSAAGVLKFDADGTGSTAAITFAKVGSGLALTNNDFHLM